MKKGLLMKKLFLAGTALLTLVAGSAMAADLSRPAPAPVLTKAPVVQVFSWSGLYIGGNVGGHWGRDSQTTTADPIGWAGGWPPRSMQPFRARSARRE